MLVTLLLATAARALLVPTTTTTVRSRGQKTVLGASTRSQLMSLSEMTVLSIDSGDLSVIEEYAATGTITDATTNPLFVAQAGTSGDPRYVEFVDRAVAYARKNAAGEEDEGVVALAMDRLAVELGLEIVKLVPGYVSTEVDIRESFDTEESLRRARRIIAMYEDAGVDRSRILIKLAGTCEGIDAARILEKEGIRCNITLVFGFVQAVYAAQAEARLISPFPGRIKDWHAANGGASSYDPDDDPGVVAVKRMFHYYKRHGHEATICMPASWRPSRPGYPLDEIRALAGVDRMTIPPNLLEQLNASTDPLPKNLDVETAKDDCRDTTPLDLSPAKFRLLLTQDICATTKLAEGINAFVAETLKLETAIKAKLLEEEEDASS